MALQLNVALQALRRVAAAALSEAGRMNIRMKGSVFQALGFKIGQLHQQRMDLQLFCCRSRSASTKLTA